MQKDTVETADMLKLRADQAKEATLYQMLSEDQEYQQNIKQLTLLEQLIVNLNLTEAQRCIINAYLELSDEVSSDYGTYAYLAGLVDSDREQELKELASSLKDIVKGSFHL